MFLGVCAISAGQKIQEQGEENDNFPTRCLNHPPYSRVSPVFEVILPYAKSCREGDFIEFVSNMLTFN